MTSDLAMQPPAIEVVKKPLTHVVIVLDRSGSMGSIWGAMQIALKEQVDNLAAKKNEQKIRLWLALFDDQYALVHGNEKLKAIDVEQVMRNNPPRGSTALFDALSDTVLHVEETVKDECAFLCIVVTDGFENASRRVTGDQLKDTLTRLQKTDRWTFVYLGANQDITQVSKATGINTGSAMAYAATQDSVFATMGANSPTTASVDSYFSARSAGTTAVPDFFRNDDEDEDEDGK